MDLRMGKSRMETVKNKMEAPLEIYVHIPFCAKKCGYCDFLSFPACREEQDSYVRALIEEIRSLPFEARKVRSVFIGGGTPSLLKESAIGDILENLRAAYTISPDAEITIEANPGTLSRGKLRCYRRYGINRLSLGLQSTDDKELCMLGRIHTFKEFLESYEWAREEGFKNINVDLISALPGQKYESWIKSLETVASLSPEHISAYSLIIEKGTPFEKKIKELPDEETEYRMYEDTASVLQCYGYRQYEISNYAKKGFECIHNIGYWKRYDYVGIGLGASSLYRGERFSNTCNMAEYLACCRMPDKIRKERTKLSCRDEMEEFMILGLRMAQGISETDFFNQFRVKIGDVYGNILEKYLNTGFMEKNKDRWKFTRKGIHVSNRILVDFLDAGQNI